MAKAIKETVTWKVIIQTFIMLCILVIFAFSFFFYANKQNEVSQQIHKDLNHLDNTQISVMKDLIHIMNQKNIVDRNEDVIKISEQTNIPLEILKEVKYFTEIMNQKQHDTLQFIVYILAFFSIIATFFGYKTIIHIKENAEKESEKLTAQYSGAYQLLKQQAELSKNFYEIQYSTFANELDAKTVKLKSLTEEQMGLSEDIKKQREDFLELLGLANLGHDLREKEMKKLKEKLKNELKAVDEKDL